jgi:hypothetical protein
MPEKYLYQVHGCMAVTGARKWWFQSWNPNMPGLRVLVKRDDFTEKLLTALVVFSQQAHKAIKGERDAYAVEFGDSA